MKILRARPTGWFFAGAVVAFAALGAPLTAIGGDMKIAGSETGKSVPGELLIKFENQISAAEAANTIENIGGEVISTMLDGSLYLVRFAYPETVPGIQSALEKMPGVAYVEPNFEVGINPPEGDSDSSGEEPGDNGSGDITIK